MTPVGAARAGAFAGQVDAIPDSVVDNFEDSPDGPYGTGDDITTYYSGDTGGASRTTSTPIADTYSLALQTSSNDYIGSVAGDGLPAYPQYGDVLSFRVRFPATDWNVEHHYATSSNTSQADAYAVRIGTGGDLQINRYDAGAYANIASSTGINYTADTVYTVICGVRDAGGADEHFAELYDQATVDRANDTALETISGNDSTHITSGSFDSRGIGFRVNTPGTNPYLIDDYWVR